MNRIRKLERLIYNHRFRSQVESKVAQRFPRHSVEFAWIMGAIDDVIETHKCQRRRNGELRQRHEFGILAIALTFCATENAEFYIACVKHDMVEDYPRVWSYDRIKDEDGEEVARLVEPVTEPKRISGETDNAYNQRKFEKVVSGGRRTKILKIIDRLTNLHTLPHSGPLSKQAGYLRETEVYVYPWCQEIGFMEEEFRLMLQKHKRRVTRQLKGRRK